MLAEDSTFWRDPPWGDGKQKYRLGLKPIPLNDWLNREIGSELFDYKTNLLNNRYEDVIGVTHDSTEAQEILGKQFNIVKRRYPDLIADISLLIQDDLCLIKSDGNQEL